MKTPDFIQTILEYQFGNSIQMQSLQPEVLRFLARVCVKACEPRKEPKWQGTRRLGELLNWAHAYEAKDE